MVDTNLPFLPTQVVLAIVSGNVSHNIIQLPTILMSSVLCSRRTRTQPYRLPITERFIRTTDPNVAAPIAVLVSRHVPRWPWPGWSSLPVGSQSHHQPAVQCSAGAGRSPPGLTVHAGLPAGRRGRRRRQWWHRQPPVQDDHQWTGRGRWPGSVSPVPPRSSPSSPSVVRRLGVRNGDAWPVLVGWQYAAARAARPTVADQRRRSANITPAAAAATTTAVVAAAAVTGFGTAAAAAATVVSVTVATTAPSSTTPPPPDGRQSAVADQQRAEVHRENGQRTGLDFGSSVGRRRTISSGDSQVNHV